MSPANYYAWNLKNKLSMHNKENNTTYPFNKPSATSRWFSCRDPDCALQVDLDIDINCGNQRLFSVASITMSWEPGVSVWALHVRYALFRSCYCNGSCTGATKNLRSLWSRCYSTLGTTRSPRSLWSCYRTMGTTRSPRSLWPCYRTMGMTRSPRPLWPCYRTMGTTRSSRSLWSCYRTMGTTRSPRSLWPCYRTMGTTRNIRSLRYSTMGTNRNLHSQWLSYSAIGTTRNRRLLSYSTSFVRALRNIHQTATSSSWTNRSALGLLDVISTLLPLHPWLTDQHWDCFTSSAHCYLFILDQPINIWTA